MAKIKFKIKEGSKGKPLGKYIAEYKAQQGGEGKKIYSSKAKLNVHFKNGGQ
jgi:hypothetical protein